MPAGQLDLASTRHTITTSVYLDEKTAVMQLLDEVAPVDHLASAIYARAAELVGSMRANPQQGVEAFLAEYRLDQKEGILIMCLAESLLRIPDPDTADKLIRDKFSESEWESHMRHSPSFLVNASSLGLMLTGRVIDFDMEKSALHAFRKLVRKMGEPVIRKALAAAMEWMGTQFILGRTIDEGLKQARKDQKKGYLHSYDILGEGARTQAFADDYASRYMDAIEKIGKAASQDNDLFARPSISIKLSALHPRYEHTHKTVMMDELMGRLKPLMLAAQKHNIMAAIDAEEAERLDISLDVFEMLIADPDFKGWNGISLVVQAYQKRALHVIRWIAALAEKHGKTIPVRLVKGAYWDTEIKLGQQLGLAQYPVFTRKQYTDLSYLACARELLDAGTLFYPQFATHNAYTAASILELAAERPKDAQHPYEFQRLHGMGASMYDTLSTDKSTAAPCRIYAPIGIHKDLLAYLVRRLLENGANTSFINQLADHNTPIEKVIQNPVTDARTLEGSPNPDIPLPIDLYGASRRNSHGYNLNYAHDAESLKHELGAFQKSQWQAHSIVNGRAVGDNATNVINPAQPDDVVGTATHTSESDMHHAMEIAHGYADHWVHTLPHDRANMLRKAGDLLEKRMMEAMALVIREAGKTVQDAIDEVREAVDFCRYYAHEAERLFANSIVLPGPTGESNRLQLHGRGLFVCISPWNFPLAIFAGQVTAALAAGNTVIAKPAEQTPLIAHLMVKILHEAGIPTDALHLLLGRGHPIGKVLLRDHRVDGVCFTGSTDTAHIIQKTLSERGGPLTPLIAETGGQNTMIVDSTALPEQVADDVIHSAFGSAGQRCSALRVLFLQEDVADAMIDMIVGAAKERKLGNPVDMQTDIGPVIDKEAQQSLQDHKNVMHKQAKLLFEPKLDDALDKSGSFLAPAIYEITSIDALTEEHFGPILHIVRYKASELEAVIDTINATGFGLTLGIHSRIDATADFIISRARVGNIYVNRGMTGAVVGVQPFGGEGLSGTGPKAGGPHYLLRFASEKTVTINTAAIGGNLELFA